jgi:hypothetical protein
MRPYQTTQFPTTRKRVHVTLDLIADDPKGVLAEAVHRGNTTLVNLVTGYLATHTVEAKQVAAKATTKRTRKPKATPAPTPVVEVAVGLQTTHDRMVAGNESARIKDAARAMYREVLKLAPYGQGHKIARPLYGQMMKAETLASAQSLWDEVCNPLREQAELDAALAEIDAVVADEGF